MPKPAPSSERFRTYMPFAHWVARRWHFVEDVEQAALLGLHLADVTAAPDLPPKQFRTYAFLRIRGEVVDHLRRVAHGGGRQGERAMRPRQPEPESVGMAVDMGLVGSQFAREPDPETDAIYRDLARSAVAKIDALPERSRDILLRRLAGEPEATIALDYGVAVPRVNQIVWDAVRIVGEPIP